MDEANNIAPENGTPMTRKEYEGYIDKHELARRIGKTVRTVDTWMEKGWIPFYKVGRAVCFRWSEVDAHIQAHFRVRLRAK